MIHGVKFIEWMLKALRDLPVCAKEQDDKELEDEDWLNNLYRCFSYSLLNEDVSVMVSLQEKWEIMTFFTRQERQHMTLL